jgi:hypothetical protein
MRWFYGSKPKEVLDEDIKWDGDLEAAHKFATFAIPPLEALKE